MKNAGAWSRKYLGYEFSDAALLERALTHKSAGAVNNERLEFLGDSILGFTITEALFQSEDNASEGTLTRLRALLVRGATLSEIARELKLGDVLRVGGGEARSGGHQRDSILADALEAVFGAVLLDGGRQQARTVILSLYATRLADLPGLEELKDPKSQLQELLQGRGLGLPRYSLEKESGPPHARHFEVACAVPDLDVITRAEGTSLRNAEQAAAEKALLLLADE